MVHSLAFLSLFLPLFQGFGDKSHSRLFLQVLNWLLRIMLIGLVLNRLEIFSLPKLFKFGFGKSLGVLFGSVRESHLINVRR